MKKILLLLAGLSLLMAEDGFPQMQEYTEEATVPKVLNKDETITISVTGEGVAPTFAHSPAQQYVLAKRAAITDAYRQIAEKINGVYLEGEDTVKNMALKSSLVRTRVNSLIKNAKIVETTYKDGLCQVDVEVRINYDSLAK